MHGVPGLCHIETGGFHTGRGIRAGNEKLVDSVCPDKVGERFARQGV